MSNSRKTAPDKIYEAALAEIRPDLTQGSLKLLKSGLAMLQEKQKEPLRETELFALTSMIAYVSHDQKVREETVVEIMTSHFNVNNVDALPSHLYMNAIEYLVDLKINHIMN